MLRFVYLPVLAVANEHVSVSPDGQLHVENVMDTGFKFVDDELEDSFTEMQADTTASSDPAMNILNQGQDFGTCCTAGGVAGCTGPQDLMKQDAQECHIAFDCMNDAGQFATPTTCICTAGANGDGTLSSTGGETHFDSGMGPDKEEPGLWKDRNSNQWLGNQIEQLIE